MGEYLLFVAKAATVAALAALLLACARRRPRGGVGRLEVRLLDREIEKRQRQVADATRTARERWRARRGGGRLPPRRRVFVLDFHGDLRASRVHQLREEITAVLGSATAEDEVVLRLESAGGAVEGYGFAASQLGRLRRAGIPLTVCVDQVAASGGYLMACVADRILAAPFAWVGSVGVVAQIPNFHRFLERHQIDFEVFTAGRHKRTLTLFGENSDAGRLKLAEQLNAVHRRFIEHLRAHRPRLDVERIASGETWLAVEALELGLVDGLSTSDEYLLRRMEEARLVGVRFRAEGGRWAGSLLGRARQLLAPLSP
ncbi:MAG: protease SohB [Porticoccaceae bacterium]|nr:MAG: protease SohB [Porticoccaceae bacterium]